MAELCRKLELKHELKQVLSPRKFLSQQQRLEHKQEQRIDQRKEQLKQNIRDCLLTANNFTDFIRKMEQRQVQVYKSRGISFTDNKKMRVKGSELGYSLSTIEKIMGYSLEKRQHLHQQLEQNRKQVMVIKDQKQSKSTSSDKSKNIEQEIKIDLCKALEILLRPEREQSQTPNELLQKKRKPKYLSQHL